MKSYVPFTIPKKLASVIEPPRWPIECKVIDETVEHIYYNPPNPEPYYLPTVTNAAPKPDEDQPRTIVYQYSLKGASVKFKRSSIGGSSHHPTTGPPFNEDLMFESRFESGNLDKAIKIGHTDYELHLRTDLYTQSHKQWFYFRVTNMKKNVIYRFSIVNLRKSDSLYKKGLKPLLYSALDAQLHGIGWTRCGNDINYFCNRNSKTLNFPKVPTCTLTFTLEFPHEDDVVYLAYCYPYTYSDLQEYLVELSEDPVKSIYTMVGLLCKSLAGNNVYYLTITAPQAPNKTKKKRAVIITARAHPSETPSSWMMKGFIDFLTSQSPSAKELREEFIFILVPMLNPDGVIVGNTRCSLAGTDLNRAYRTASRYTHPSIFYTLLLIQRTIPEFDVAMYCDLHAHSRRHNMFIFGCEDSGRSLEFPFFLYGNAADRFSYRDCNFGIEVTKETTARVTMFKMGITHSYTMEASFAGSLLGSRRETHFAVKDYEVMGSKFCRTLLEYYNDKNRTPLDYYGTYSGKNDARTPSEESTYETYVIEGDGNEVLPESYKDVEENYSNVKNSAKFMYEHASTSVENSDRNANCYDRSTQTSIKVSRNVHDDDSVFVAAIKQSATLVKNSTTVVQNSKNIDEFLEESKSSVKDLAKVDMSSMNSYDEYPTQVEESESVVKKESALRMKCLREISQCSKGSFENVSIAAEEIETAAKKLTKIVKRLKITYEDIKKGKAKDFEKVGQNSGSISKESGTAMIIITQVDQQLKNTYKAVDKMKRILKDLGNISQRSRGTHDNVLIATEKIKSAAKKLKKIVQILKIIYEDLET